MPSPDDSESSSDKDCEEQGDDYPTGCDETEAVSTMNHVGLVVKLERRVGKILEKAMISLGLGEDGETPEKVSMCLDIATFSLVSDTRPLHVNVSALLSGILLSYHPSFVAPIFKFLTYACAYRTSK
ncbi:hypothetical protein V8E54_008575 [Elaphomyces granulatus]